MSFTLTLPASAVRLLVISLLVDDALLTFTVMALSPNLALLFTANSIYAIFPVAVTFDVPFHVNVYESDIFDELKLAFPITIPFVAFTGVKTLESQLTFTVKSLIPGLLPNTTGTFTVSPISASASPTYIFDVLATSVTVNEALLPYISE